MHGVIRLSNMIELLPPPLAEGALGDTIGDASCSRDGGQLNLPLLTKAGVHWGDVACSRDGEQLSVT